MATSYLKEYLLSQLCKLGIDWPPPKEEEKPVVVQQTLTEAGYTPLLPTDEIPVALLPGMLRLDKQSWLNALSIEATFSSDVEDGDLVYPVAAGVSGEFISNIAELRDAVWKPVNQVSGTASTDENSPRIWGIAYKHVGRVMFGPVVFHQRFAFKTGDILYVGNSGEITTNNEGAVLGICLAPGSIFIDLSVTSSKLALDALQERVDKLEQGQEEAGGSISDLTEEIKDIQKELDKKLENGDAISNSTVVASGSTTNRPLKDRFADVINVKDFGAIGDGVADDTEAIQNALNAAAVFKDTILEDSMNYVQNCVFFPAGTYIISGTLFVGEGTTIFGASQSSSIIKATHIGIAIQCGNTDRYYSQINITRLSIVGNFSGDVSSYDFTTGTTVGIQFIRCVRNCSISECLIFGCSTNIQGISSWTLDIRNNIIQNAKAYLIHLDNGNNVRIVKNRLDKSGGNGIYIEKVEGYTTNCLEIRDNAIQYCWESGVLLEACYQVTFSGNDFENNGRGSSTVDNRYADIYIAEHPSASSILGVFTLIGNLHTVNDSYERTNFAAIICEKAYSVNIFNEVCLSIDNFLLVDDGSVFVNALGNRIKNPDYPNVTLKGGGPAKYFCSDLEKSNIPESTSLAFRVVAKDKNREDIGCIEEIIDANGNSYLRFRVPNFESSSYEESFLYIIASKNNNYAVVNGNFRPYKDDEYYMGVAANRWKEIFAANSVINTSDEREKQSISSYSDAVLDAWEDVEFRQFLFNNAVAKKGKLARIHSGIVAQQVIEAFAAKNIDATKYSLLCYDEWPEEKDEAGNIIKEAGSRYGIRYSEALCLEAAYQRRRASRLEARVAAIETAIQNLNLPTTSGEEPTNE